MGYGKGRPKLGRPPRAKQRGSELSQLSCPYFAPAVDGHQRVFNNPPPKWLADSELESHERIILTYQLSAMLYELHTVAPTWEDALRAYTSRVHALDNPAAPRTTSLKPVAGAEETAPITLPDGSTGEVLTRGGGAEPCNWPLPEYLLGPDHWMDCFREWVLGNWRARGLRILELSEVYQMNGRPLTPAEVGERLSPALKAVTVQRILAEMKHLYETPSSNPGCVWEEYLVKVEVPIHDGQVTAKKIFADMNFEALEKHPVVAQAIAERKGSYDRRVEEAREELRRAKEARRKAKQRADKK